ncbi:MAG: CotH kinase family protein [Oscillospiraceae bacterium]|nr:CotH kinase family protein [Oscillospiraceae bacterium]
MNERSRKIAYKFILTAAVAVCLAVMIFVTVLAQNWVSFHASEITVSSLVTDSVGSTDQEPVRFSIDCGFYSSTQRLYLSAAASGNLEMTDILYTTDGSEPQTSGESYSGGITLSVKDSEDCILYTIRACAVYSDGSYSETVTRSYFLGANIDERFDCLVFSISIDPDYLYNYEDGIFIAGKMRDDYLATNPEGDIEPTDPANWNQSGMEGERPAYVEVYEYDGTCVISQACGLRIYGGWSRSNSQKNIRLFAREEYDSENDRFRYEFFTDETDVNGDKIKSYNKISLRAGANDNGYLFERDEVISSLADDAGLDAKNCRAAAVFLNGEYYGFAWVQDTYSEDWLDHQYAVEQGTWDILEGCKYMMTDCNNEDRYEEAKSDWETVQAYAYKDLTDDAIFAELEEMLDIDNMLTYYALCAYVGNSDWPNNNYKVYRFVSGDTSLSSEEDVFDGRWRFLIYDSDFALGLYGSSFFDSNISDLFDETYFGLMPEDWYDDVHDEGEKYTRSDLLIALCKRDDIKERFVNILCDIMNWYCDSDKVSDELDALNTERLHEIVEAGNAGTTSTWSISSELESAKEWIEGRPYSAKRQISSVFPEYDSNSTYYVRVTTSDYAEITYSTARIDVSDEYTFSGYYFVGTSQTLSCQVVDGYKFEYWEINGEKVYDETVEISSEIYGKNIKISLVTSCETASLRISEVCYKGSYQDYITLKNYGDETVSLAGLTISDGTYAYTITSGALASGEEMKLVCENYLRDDAVGLVQLSFNLSEFETVTLTDATGEVISEVYLRDAAKNSALKYDELSDSYVQFTPYPKTRTLEAELPTRWR